MNEVSKYVGPFPVPDEQVGQSCIDYWFDDLESNELSKTNPLVPDGYKALARDPGDNLVLAKHDGSIYYVDHETCKLIFLAKSLTEFLDTISEDK